MATLAGAAAVDAFWAATRSTFSLAPPAFAVPVAVLGVVAGATTAVVKAVRRRRSLSTLVSDSTEDCVLDPPSDFLDADAGNCRVFHPATGYLGADAGKFVVASHFAGKVSIWQFKEADEAAAYFEQLAGRRISFCLKEDSGPSVKWTEVDRQGPGEEADDEIRETLFNALGRTAVGDDELV
jgi:hypothetical protein